MHRPLFRAVRTMRRSSYFTRVLPFCPVCQPGSRWSCASSLARSNSRYCDAIGCGCGRRWTSSFGGSCILDLPLALGGCVVTSRSHDSTVAVDSRVDLSSSSPPRNNPGQPEEERDEELKKRTCRTRLSVARHRGSCVGSPGEAGGAREACRREDRGEEE